MKLTAMPGTHRLHRAANGLFMAVAAYYAARREYQMSAELSTSLMVLRADSTQLDRDALVAALSTARRLVMADRSADVQQVADALCIVGDLLTDLHYSTGEHSAVESEVRYV